MNDKDTFNFYPMSDEVAARGMPELAAGVHEIHFTMNVNNALEELEDWKSLPEFNTVEDLFKHLDLKE